MRGVINLLEAVRVCPSVRVVVNATTDKVYESHEGRAYKENDPLGGHDPYSTSKACSELVSASYRKSFFEPEGKVVLATARAGNVIGGGDWAADRLIPDLVRAASSGEPLRLRNPGSTRPWQHVLEPLSGYLAIGQALMDGTRGDAWNLAPTPGATLRVGEVIDRLAGSFPDVTVEHDPGPHLHEAPTLELDPAKAERELGWRGVWDADATLSRTAEWYRAYLTDGTVRTRDDLTAYVADARSAGLGWAGA